jgi:hypothetical protein
MREQLRDLGVNQIIILKMNLKEGVKIYTVFILVSIES